MLPDRLKYVGRNSSFPELNIIGKQTNFQLKSYVDSRMLNE